MCDTRQTARIVEAVEKAKNARLILTGDHRQLQSVGAGGSFKGLCEKLGYAELSEVVRQRKSEDREMVEAFRDGRTAEAVANLAKRNRVEMGSEVADSQERLVRRWGRDATGYEDKFILASTNKQVDSLNERCQEGPNPTFVSPGAK